VRPKFTLASEEMQRISSLLAAEVLRWPGTRVGKMFGMQSVYRGEAIFGLLPAARCMWESDSIAVKMNSLPGAEGKKWQPVLVRGDGDLRTALKRLDEAYRAAGVGRTTGAKRSRLPS
jgi:hypothetical protein